MAPGIVNFAATFLALFLMDRGHTRPALSPRHGAMLRCLLRCLLQNEKRFILHCLSFWGDPPFICPSAELPSRLRRFLVLSFSSSPEATCPIAVGRKQLLISGAIGMAISMCALATMGLAFVETVGGADASDSGSGAGATDLVIKNRSIG